MSTLLKALFLIIAILAVFSIFFYFSVPPVASLKYLNPKRTTLMLARRGMIQQTWVPLEKICPSLRRAVVEAEDGNFYHHHGVDLHEFRESLRKNMKKRRFARGFSTITMQLAKNLYLSPQKTVTRKLLEIMIAYRMERVLSKDRILELYLNVVEWGRGIYGAEAAAEHYFKKTADSLSAQEAAFLAAILPNPRRWGRWPPGPYVQRRQQALLARIGGKPFPQKEMPELPELPSELPPESSPTEIPEEESAPTDLEGHL